MCVENLLTERGPGGIKTFFDSKDGREDVMAQIIKIAGWLAHGLIISVLMFRRLDTDKRIRIMLLLIPAVVSGCVSVSLSGFQTGTEKNQYGLSASAVTGTPTPELLIFEPSPTLYGADFRITMTAAAKARKIPVSTPEPTDDGQYGIIKLITFRQPFDGTYPVTQGYHEYNQYVPPGRAHTGIDYACPAGTKILAGADGTVMAAGGGSTGFGLHVIIRHTDDLATLYAHLDSISVSVGQYVSQGDVIGLSGSSGDTTGPHLHFEVRTKWDDKTSYINPGLLPPAPEK